MSYTLLGRRLCDPLPDLPRQGPEPDGDTVKFAPDSPALVESLPRLSGRAPDLNARGISVRLEAIDTLETHFELSHQELAGANEARDRLLALLGFANVRFWPDLPNKVQSTDHDRIRGHVLSNAIDGNGRMIGFVYAGAPAEPDGSDVFSSRPAPTNRPTASCSPKGTPTRRSTPRCRRSCARISRAARAAPFSSSSGPRTSSSTPTPRYHPHPAHARHGRPPLPTW